MQKLIYNETDYPSFALPWVRPVVERYFELEQYNPEKTYDPRDAVLITYASRHQNTWHQRLTQAGHKLVVDHLWDSDVEHMGHATQQELELRCPDWMWYLACFEFEHHGYKSYQPQRTHKHSFLMLMNNARWHRDALLAMLEPVLPTAVYSYNSRNITLPNDKDPGDFTPWQRYMNPTWYDTTAFSVVAESYMRDTVDRSELGTEVSEKIFKPLAYFHPYIVAGSAHTLSYLHSRGFESFSTWFDESYDTVVNDRLRLATVSNEIESAVHRWQRKEIGWDSETIRRTQHNHDLMFDRTTVERRFDAEVIRTVQEFLCDY